MILQTHSSHTTLLQDHRAAVKRIKAIQTREKSTPGFDPRLQTILLTRGRKTRRVVLWFHGYSATTLQFKPLAELCHARGDNVLVPCMPHHGLKDQLTAETSRVKARELVAFTSEMVDLAHGLGEELVIGGLSMGGVMTAWAAQERADVSTALIIAPFLGTGFLPAPLTRAAAFLLGVLPDYRQWWNPADRKNPTGSDPGYRLRSTHSLVQILKLGFRVRARGRRKAPAAGRIWVVINDHDDSVNNGMIQQLARIWERSGARQVQVFHFPDEWGIPHACVNLERPDQKTDLVYPRLLEMIYGEKGG